MRDRNIACLWYIEQICGMKTGCPEPFFGGRGGEASVAREIVYMSMREALTEMREGIGVRTSEKKRMVRAPISQLETAMLLEVYEHAFFPSSSFSF
jgi:hypothetical protein